jgi:hypothetical protein
MTAEINGNGGYVYGVEINRRLDEVLSEFRLLRQELVRRDVYEVERRADAATMATLRGDIDALERRLVTSDDARAATRRAATLAVLGATLSLVVSLVMQLIPQ